MTGGGWFDSRKFASHLMEREAKEEEPSHGRKCVPFWILTNVWYQHGREEKQNGLRERQIDGGLNMMVEFNSAPFESPQRSNANMGEKTNEMVSQTVTTYGGLTIMVEFSFSPFGIPELIATQQENKEQHDRGLKTNHHFQFLRVVSLFCIVFSLNASLNGMQNGCCRHGTFTGRHVYFCFSF